MSNEFDYYLGLLKFYGVLFAIGYFAYYIIISNQVNHLKLFHKDDLKSLLLGDELSSRYKDDEYCLNKLLIHRFIPNAKYLLSLPNTDKRFIAKILTRVCKEELKFNLRFCKPPDQPPQFRFYFEVHRVLYNFSNLLIDAIEFIYIEEISQQRKELSKLTKLYKGEKYIPSKRNADYLDLFILSTFRNTDIYKHYFMKESFLGNIELKFNLRFCKPPDQPPQFRFYFEVHRVLYNFSNLLIDAIEFIYIEEISQQRKELSKLTKLYKGEKYIPSKRNADYLDLFILSTYRNTDIYKHYFMKESFLGNIDMFQDLYVRCRLNGKDEDLKEFLNSKVFHDKLENVVLQVYHIWGELPYTPITLEIFDIVMSKLRINVWSKNCKRYIERLYNSKCALISRKMIDDEEKLVTFSKMTIDEFLDAKEKGLL